MRISDWSSDVCSSDLAGATAAVSPWARALPGRLASIDAAHVAAKKFLALEGIRPSFILLRFPFHSCLLPPPDRLAPLHSAERRVGKACGSTFRSLWSPYY